MNEPIEGVGDFTVITPVSISKAVAFSRKKKTVFLTILSAEGMAKTGYASRVNKVLTLDALF